MQANPIGAGVFSDAFAREGCSCQIEANKNGASRFFYWLRHDNKTNRTALRVELGGAIFSVWLSLKEQAMFHVNFCPIILMVGSRPTMDITGNGELGFDSGEGA